MFSKKDFLDYFEQVRKLETDMARLASVLVRSVDDEFLKKNFQDIMTEEARHANEIKKIVEIIRLNS